jgi:flagellar motor switch protein FliN/FliY
MMEQPMPHPEHEALPAPDVTAAFMEEFDASPEPQTGGLSNDAVLDDLEAVFDVPVKVQAVLGRSRMPIGDLLRLKGGMVIELDRRVGEPVDIFVNDRLIARGEVVLIDNSLGVTLTEIVQPER